MKAGIGNICLTFIYANYVFANLLYIYLYLKLFKFQLCILMLNWLENLQIIL